MKKFSFFFVIFFSLFQVHLFAQDIIYKTDGSAEEVKVVQVGEDEIQYKKFSNLDGPVYVISKKDIVLITYENGEYDMVNAPAAPESLEKSWSSEEFAPNILNFHFLDIMYGDVTFSYERIIGSGIVGIQVPLGFGYAYHMDYFDGNDNWVKNRYFSGLGVYFYPFGQTQWRYLVGPKFIVGYGKQEDYVYYYDDNGDFLYSNLEDNEGIYFKYMVENGVRFSPIKNFSVAAVLGIGVRFFPDAGDSYDEVRPTGHFGMNVSYCF